MATVPPPTADPTPAAGRGRAAVPAALVAGAAAVVLLANLGAAPLWDDDEPKNTACTVAMLAAGDWVVPRFNAALRSDKPPLVNWIQMAGFAACGVNETGARVGSALLTVGTALLVASCAGRLFPALPLVGLWSGLAMGTCVWSAVAGRAATPDAALCFCTTLALWIFTRSRFPAVAAAAGPRAGVAAGAALGAALGAAVLAKGPVGFVLPLLALGLFVGWQALAAPRSGAAGPVRNVVAAWRELRPAVVVAAALLVAGPWCGLVWQRTAGAWVRDFLFTHNVGRFAAPMEGHDGPPYYYLVVVLAGLFPWSVVAGVAAADAVGCARRGHDAAPLRLLAAWAAVWIGCFSLSGTKLPGYVWPAYPAATIVLGWFLERWRLGLAGWADRWLPVAWLTLAAAGVGIGVALPLVCADGGPGRWPAPAALGAIGAVPLATAALAAAAQASGMRTATVCRLAGGGCLTVMLVAAFGPASAGRATGVRPLVAALAGPADDRAWAAAPAVAWGTYGCAVPGLVFYSGAAARGDRVARLEDLADARRFFAAHPRGHAVVPAARVDELLAAAPPRHRVLARARHLSGNRELALVGPPPDELAAFTPEDRLP